MRRVTHRSSSGAGIAVAAIATAVVAVATTVATAGVPPDGLQVGLRTAAGASTPALIMPFPARAEAAEPPAEPAVVRRLGHGPIDLTSPAFAPSAPRPLEPVPGPAATTLEHQALVATAIGEEIVVRAEPGPEGAEAARFANPIPSGAPLVFLVLGRSGDWLEVSLPVRPNGSTGWIPASAVTLSRNRYRIEVDVSDHRLVVFDSGRPVLDTPVGIGTGSTPTPIGSFYLIELLAPNDPGGMYGPYAFGLSGYSETLLSFNGGRGVIGIHGTNDPSSVGRDASNGCVRVANDVISHMATFLPLGTPVEIRP